MPRKCFLDIAKKKFYIFYNFYINFFLPLFFTPQDIFSFIFLLKKKSYAPQKKILRLEKTKTKKQKKRFCNYA